MNDKRTINGYELTTNPFNCGIQCTFEHNGKHYWADLCYLKGYDVPTTECMIFESDGKRVIDWSERYCNRDIQFSDKSLISCIEDFKNENPD